MRAASIVTGVLLAIASIPARADFGSGLIRVVNVVEGGGSQATCFRVSPDGRHVYAAGLVWLETYARDPASGAAEPVDAILLGGKATSLALSPDGVHVYVATQSSQSSRLLVYERDLETGVPTLRDETEASAESIAVSPDGAFLYGRSGGALVAFPRDPVSGTLGEPITVAAYGGSDFAISPDGAHVYVIGSPTNPVLEIHARNAETGGLTLLDSLVQDENDVDLADIDVSPDGRDVYLASEGRLLVFARDDATGLLAFDGRIETGSARSSVVAGNGFAWVLQHFCCFKDDGVLILKAYARGAAPDALTFLDSTSVTWDDWYYPAPGAAGLSEIALAPDSTDVYFGNSATVSLWAARLAPANGVLAEIQSVGDASIVGARSALVTPDGRHLVIVAPAGLVVLARDPGAGTVSLVEVETELLGDARAVASSPDGRFVYVADRSAGVVRFARDAASGALVAVDAAGGGLTAGADAVALNEDGTRLYAGGHEAGEVALFARDDASGALAHVETVSIPQVRDLTVSTDGRFLYVDRSEDPAIPSFTSVHPIDTEAGSVDPTGVDLGARVAVASRDGKHLYQVSRWFWFESSCPSGPPLSCPDALRIYALDPASGGRGAPLGEMRDALLASGNVVRMALSRDGRFLYLSRPAPLPYRHPLRSCLVAFAREQGSGALSYLDADCQPLSTFAIAPSGAHVYAIDDASGTLRVYYTPEPGGGAVALTALAALAALASRRRAAT